MGDDTITLKDRYSIRIIITLILVLIVYSNTIYYPFHYDDIGVAIQSKIVEEPLSGFWKNTVGSGGDIFLHRLFLLYSFALNYHWGDGSVVSYRVINIIFHFLNSLLIYLILKNILILNYSISKYKYSLSKKSHLKFIPFFSSLIFAVHPLNTETITFISSRSSGMSTFFFLLSFYLFIRGNSGMNSPDKKNNKTPVFCYALSLLVFFIGLGTKEIIATLPVIIILYLYYFANQEKTLYKFLLKFKWYLTAIAFPVIAYLAYRKVTTGDIFSAHADDGLNLYGRYFYLLTELKVIIFYYLKLFIFPINLNIYPMMSTSTSLFELPVFISLFIILSLIIFAAAIIRDKEANIEKKVISFSVFWFFITLLPSSSFIPLNDTIAEHRAYLPAVGASIFFGTTFSIFVNSIDKRVKLTFFKSFSLMLILLLFSLLSIQRNFDWKDTYTLWKDTALKTPYHAKPHIGLGAEYTKRGLNKLAVEEFKKAIEIFPAHAGSHYNLGITYSNLRDYENAATELLLAVQYDKNNFRALFALGNTYSKIGQYDKAINAYNIADLIHRKTQNKSYLEAIHNLGEVYGKTGKLNEAIKQFQKVLDIDPNHILARTNLAQVYKYLEDPEKANK